MQEFLHLKEKALLKYIANHYKRTLEVQFTLFTINHTTVFINDFTTISVENLAELYNLLTSLMIRNYICFDEKRGIDTFLGVEITLTEKALNFFNSGKPIR